MQGRFYTANNSTYRYGFNGKEKDPNITGEDYDYGARIYDARVGRFLSIDPITKKYPWYTPYQFAGNSPIKNIDLDGLEPAGNQSDWEVVPGSVNVYTASHTTEKGKTVITRAEEQLVKDKTGAQYWVTHHQWSETADGITSSANDYSWYNKDSKIKLPAKDVGRWQRFETDIIKEQKGNWQMADNIGKVTFGVAVGMAAAPVASNLGLLNPGLNISRATFTNPNLWSTAVKAKLFSGIGNAAADATYQLIKGGDYNPWSTAGNFVFSNPLFSALPGSVSQPDANFLKTYGRNVFGDALGNIPVGKIPGISRGLATGMENFTLPLLGNLASEVTTGKIKEEVQQQQTVQPPKP